MQDVQTPAEPRLVEIVLTEEQAGFMAIAADVVLRSNADEEHGIVTLSDEEKADFERLAVFFTTVAANPQHFPVVGRMARTIKARAPKRPKPAAGNTANSTLSPRKKRQLKRRAFHKARRKQRRSAAELFNMARADMEQAMQEQQAEVERRQAEIENEPKFDVTDILGNVVIAGVPQSMIQPVAGPDDEAAEEFRVAYDAAVDKPKVILPGTAEALGVERP